MKSIWKGHIRFLLVAIPVRIYNALETSEKIHLNLLHKDDYGPIGYDKRCKKCNKIVTNEDLIKGYQYAPDQYAILEPDDLQKVKLRTTRVIDIVGFADPSEIPVALYDSPYYAGPDGEVSARSYALLRQVLEESGKVGVGKVILRDREDFVLIAPHKEGLIMHKLHYPQELRKISEVPQIDQQQQVDKKELQLARTLVDQMVVSVNEIEMRDQYSDALREIINAKIEGKEVIGFVEEEQPTVDIMTALKQSIKEAERKPMVKATGKASKQAAVEEEKEKPRKARKRKAS